MRSPSQISLQMKLNAVVSLFQNTYGAENITGPDGWRHIKTRLIELLQYASVAKNLSLD